MDKVVYVKTLEYPKDKNGRPYYKVTDQENYTFNIFQMDIKLEVGKSYLFTYEIGNGNYPNVFAIKPVVNILQQKALKEVSNRNDIIRTYTVACSYSKDLVIGGKIELGELFEWANRFYDEFNKKADEVMDKIDKGE